MSREHWTHVLGNTWCLNLSVTIPVYFLNPQEVVLLDTGYADPDRETLLGCLAEKKLRVRAILGSHSHNDHSGSHRYLQETCGTEVILPEVEAAIVLDYNLMTAAYGPATAEDNRQHFSPLLLRADRTFPPEARTVTIDGAVFGVVPLPGHTPGHTGIVTPDDVLYAGDAVLSEETLAVSKLPSTRDWVQDIDSKERMKNMRHAKYILAHGGVYDDISDLIDRNIADKLERAEQILQWLRETGPATQSDIEQLLWAKLGLRSRRFLSQVVFQRNARCALDYLERTGRLTREFRDGTDRFTVKS